MKKVIAGYADINKDQILTEEDAMKLTHLNLSFGYIDHGEIEFNQDQLYKQLGALRSANPDLKILLSLVGKTGADFPIGSSTEEGRKKIARSCAEIVTKYGFDGIDLDWEYPCCPENCLDASPADKQNFTALIVEIRKTMQVDCSPSSLLTIAAGADAYFTESAEMDIVSQYLDYVFIMTYDFRCGFHALTGHHTNLYTATGDIFRTSCDNSAKLFLHAGVPKNKIILGAAFYSRKWEDVANRNNGFLQYTKTACTYGPSYHELVEAYIDQNGFIRYWDDECKAPFLYDGHTFLSYDDPESLRHKVDYIRDHHLGGIFYWNHANDMTHTLLETLYQQMNRPIA